MYLVIRLVRRREGLPFTQPQYIIEKKYKTVKNMCQGKEKLCGTDLKALPENLCAGHMRRKPCAKIRSFNEKRYRLKL